jgi:hypothetical protein
MGGHWIDDGRCVDLRAGSTKLPATRQGCSMSNKQIYLIIGVLLVWFWAMVIMAVLHFASPKPIKYDCSLASFHPDVPVDVRKECRKVRT